jgi:single-strand DNA-binding protein
MTAQVTIVGNLTSDPELKSTKTGSSVLKVGVAVNRRWKNKQDEWEETVSYFDVNAWGELADNVAASLSKGSRVIVSGRLEQQSWENKEGQKQSKVVLVADDFGVSLRKAQVSGINKTGQQQQQQRQSSGKSSDWTAEDPF